MKINSYLYPCIISVGCIFGACSLEEEPYGFISTENFYQTERDAQSSLIYAYSLLPEIEYYSRNFIALTEIPTENVSIKPDAGASNFELDELRPLANNIEATTAFRYGFIGVNRSNAIIANVPDIVMDEVPKNQIMGEAYFLRALHYFNLVRLFGAVPLRDTPIEQQDQAFGSRASMEDIYALIEADLLQAIALTDLVHWHGRANKAAAWSLLSKVYITLASGSSTASPGYEFVTDADAMYQYAALYAAMVMEEQSVYGFDDDLLDIFATNAEDGPEHIFSVSADRSGIQEGNYSKLPLMFIPSIDGATFTLADGTAVLSGWNHFTTEEALYNSFDPQDLRKTLLIVSTVWLEGREINLGINDYSPPFTRKFLDPDRVGDQTSTNTPVIRYSDILLIYAEAVGPTPAGYAAINQVRSRAGIAPLSPGLDIIAFRDAVIQERAWELAFEGQRLFDLRRTRKMEEILVEKYGKTIQSGAYFFAIPQIEVDVNTGI